MRRFCGFATYFVAIAVLTFLCQPAAATIVNIDFNGWRPGDAGQAPTYVGASAAGSGTVWNGVAVDSSTGNDNLTVTVSGLLNDTGTSTSIGFTISPVGGDDNPSGGSPNALFRDYLFDHSVGNTSDSPFTISGLGSVSTANLYFYHQFDSGTFAPLEITIGSETSDPFTATGIFTSSNTLFFANVPVTGGSISGSMKTTGGPSEFRVMNGLTVQYVPEPSSLALLGFGAIGLFRLAARRRKA